MITFGGNDTLSPIYISKFDASSAVPTKHIADPMSLSDAVSQAGSEWIRVLTDSMTLVQQISDFYGESEADAISFSDTAVGTVDRPAAATSTMSMVDSFIYTGTITTGSSAPSSTVSATFDSNTSKGMALYISGSGNVDLAQADAIGTKGVVGLASAAVLATATGDYQMEGQITQSDWSAVIGSTTLTAGSFYFLDESTAGRLTDTPTTTPGEYVVRVGRALTTTTLDIEVAQPILL